ncbi:hypothetical protein GFS24_25050 [Chitinophaga sp. SYP-B3965]|uniref:patatin-like phospholipase family protein n=1 Tax=Chitinophaga sp. SYP-B3965 TaxID=2663120 RepID=UPI00129988B5|nr:patatin-like phospholipase family protein [Chitinophaga sp. SYP-B3965]MRG48407.1 hypothetical protein [Chitinophaga sp. SYP-B3965]
MPEFPNELGLSLSGGGYRAAAFHLGTLNKLEELGILSKVDVLSTISGGSITGAAWCLHKGDYKRFHEEMKTALKEKSVIKAIIFSWIFIRTFLLILSLLTLAIWLTFTSWSQLSYLVFALLIFLLLKYQFKIFNVSKVIERTYNKFFYKGKTLHELNERPLLVIGSSNLHTGRPFSFSRLKMSDSTYAYNYSPPIVFKPEKFPIARAVMASSCVPFIFSPVMIAGDFFDEENDFKRIRPVLVDGGVYDNQGIQKITQEKSSYLCRVIITSDAGGGFIADKRYPNTLALLLRSVNLFMYRIKTAQMTQHVYKNVKGSPIAYFSLDWKLQYCLSGFVKNMTDRLVPDEVISKHGFDAEWLKDPRLHQEKITAHLIQSVKYEEIIKRGLNEDQLKIASKTGTNLRGLSEDRINFLIRHAENLTELQVRLYCPDLI